MRVAISGSANTGKSTITRAFLNQWPMYVTPEKTYRDVLKEAKLEHSSNTNEETQLAILNWMMEEQLKHPKDSKVIYDRCPLDNLAYTLHANANNLVGDEVTAATISFVKESMKNLDIIFWLKYDPDIRIVDDDLRDTNIQYIKEIDGVFQELHSQYMNNLENDIFFPKEDCPAIIILEGKTVEQRLSYIGEFLDYKGELIETQDSVLSPENLAMYEQLMKDQQFEASKQQDIKKMVSQIANFKI